MTLGRHSIPRLAFWMAELARMGAAVVNARTWTGISRGMHAPGSLILTAVLLLLGRAATAQQAPQSTGRLQRLAVFLDCDRCDFDHLRREVAFVDYVRDRRDAHVHVLITTRRPGAGGQEYSLDFIGLREFDGQRNRIVYTAGPTDTEDEERRGLVRALTAGLAPFAANTAMGARLLVTVDGAGEPAQEPVADPWNYWSFRASGNGRFFVEQLTQSYAAGASFVADRTTDALHVRLAASGRLAEDRFELSDSETVVSTTSDYVVEAAAVKSLDRSHWGLGGEVSGRRSTRLNQDLALRLRAAVEYSVFPYEESTRRRFTVLGLVGLAAFDYQEPTLFDRLEEKRVEIATETRITAVQPWGEVHVGFEAQAFADDLSQHRIELFGGLSLRIVRGLTLDVFGGLARIKDQIYLPAGDIPPEDILLRRRQLGTDFSAEMSVGVSYRFGSIFNNIVNPRLSTLF